MALSLRDRATRVVGAGLTMVVTVGLLAYGGIWLDRRLGTNPLFVVVGALLGVVGGTLHLIGVVAPEMLPFRRKAPAPPRADRQTNAVQPKSGSASDDEPRT
jgi:hypothetical protein